MQSNKKGQGDGRISSRAQACCGTTKSSGNAFINYQMKSRN